MSKKSRTNNIGCKTVDGRLWICYMPPIPELREFAIALEEYRKRRGLI